MKEGNLELPPYGKWQFLGGSPLPPAPAKVVPVTFLKEKKNLPYKNPKFLNYKAEDSKIHEKIPLWL